MSLNVRELSPELAKKAQEELNEIPSRLAEDVQTLRAWAQKQPHLRARLDDQNLLNFLRGSKHSLERAKEKLDLFYTIRSSMPEIFADKDPKSAKNLELIRLGTFLPLPKTLTPDGPRIIVMRVGAYDPSKYNVYDIFRAQSLVNAIAMYEDDHMVVAGQTGFIDMANASMSHFLQMTPSVMKKLSLMSQEAVPIRMKGFHHVNAPKGFETVFNLFKGFMNEKNQQRVGVDVKKNGPIDCYNYFSDVCSWQQHGSCSQVHSKAPAAGGIRRREWNYSGTRRILGEEGPFL